MHKQKNILAVGSIALDTLKTPHGNRENVLGGSATYFAIAAGLLAPVKLIGVVGSDFPEEGWQLFRSRKINTDNIFVEDGPTFRWGGKYSDDYTTRDTLFTELGVFENFSPSILESDKQSPLVFLGNIHPDLQASVAGQALKPEYIVTDTMNLWIDICPEKVIDVLKLSNILLINHEEAEQLTGQPEVDNAASELLSLGPEIVVIKRGADGAYVAHRNARYSVPAFSIKTLNDPTGAGDSFAGGFMGCLSRSVQPDFLEAVIVGSAMASFCVEGFGVETLLTATPDILEQRVSAIKQALAETV